MKSVDKDQQIDIHRLHRFTRMRKIPVFQRHMALAEEIGVAVRIVPDWHLKEAGHAVRFIQQAQ